MNFISWVKSLFSSEEPFTGKHKYSWKPDLPDIRDFQYAESFVKCIRGSMVQPDKLPTLVDLRPQMPPVVDQGQLGSCTANSLAGDLGFLEIKCGKVFAPLSRLFIYYDERALEGTINQDSGAMLRDGIKTLASQGVCSEALWPYNVAQFRKRPAPACYVQAATHKITSYHRLNTLADMKSCLASGYPFVFGFTVYESFESNAVAQTGVVSIPTPGEKPLGGHAVCAVGYDDSTQRFLVRNSWGPGWGQAGYFTIPYNYLTNSNLASDFWTMLK
jgi:C1A family cysteine protease